MIYLIIITALGFILFASFAEGIEWKERYAPISYLDRIRLNKIWHWLQFNERLFGIAFGFILSAVYGFSVMSLKIVFAVGVMFWIIYDIIINYYRNTNIFEPSQYSTSIFEKLAWLKPILVLLTIVLFAVGCSQARYIDRVKVDTLKIAPPTVEKFLDTKLITDTVIVTNEVVKQDTVIDVRYYPVEKKFYVKVKPDTVEVIRLDTVSQTIIKEEKSQGLLNYIFAVILLALIGLTIKIIRSN
ncbi:hypothetical protein [Ignavibacterium sp.]|uniref:hypothetical protein n=1 Tax=Ignavibacterium sp. TaxID=2651167 RepID=UPI00307FA9BB